MKGTGKDTGVQVLVWLLLLAFLALGVLRGQIDRPQGASGPAGPLPQCATATSATTTSTAAPSESMVAAFPPAGEPAPSPHAPYLPPDEAQVSLLVDTYRFRLTLLVNGYPVKAWPVAVGKGRTPTPRGHWRIVRKARNWGRGFGTRWLGLDVPWGIYGIHGTNKPWSIGQRASAGCVRMRNEDIEELYEWVKPGTPVRILGPPVQRRVLLPGHRGADVLRLQQRLQELGYYHGPLDGRYGPGTAAAVRAFQRAEKLPVTGEAREAELRALGLAKPPVP